MRLKAFLPWTKTNQVPKATPHRACDFQSCFSYTKGNSDCQIQPAAGPGHTPCSSGRSSASCVAPRPQRTGL